MSHYMENIIETCKSLDYSWLPPEIGNFKLKVTGPDEIVKAQETLAAGEAVLTLPLFNYENDLGWKWCALYDKEVEDYTVHVVMPLFTFVDISFVRQEFEPFWQGLQERCVQGLSKLLINSAENFTYTYMRKGLQNWDYESVMPAELEGFVRDITPKNAVRMINGSYIIGEYRKMDECTGLLLYYNEYRDEFFAELRYQNYPEIDHHLDAKSLDDLEHVLSEHLKNILCELNSRG